MDNLQDQWGVITFVQNINWFNIKFNNRFEFCYTCMLNSHNNKILLNLDCLGGAASLLPQASNLYLSKQPGLEPLHTFILQQVYKLYLEQKNYIYELIINLNKPSSTNLAKNVAMIFKLFFPDIQISLQPHLRWDNIINSCSIPNSAVLGKSIILGDKIFMNYKNSKINMQIENIVQLRKLIYSFKNGFFIKLVTYLEKSKASFMVSVNFYNYVHCKAANDNITLTNSLGGIILGFIPIMSGTNSTTIKKICSFKI